MPLTGEQKRTIEESISHLLEFSTNPVNFLQNEKELTFALSHPIDQKNEYYWLRECLLNPTAHFQSITMQGPPIIVGEIQDYILDTIETRLNATRLKPMQWNKEDVKNSLPPENWTTAFISKKAPIEGGALPFQLPQLEGKIYTQELLVLTETQPLLTEDDFPVDLDIDFPLDLHFQIAYVDVTVTGLSAAPKQRRVKLRELPTNFQDDNEENQYLESLKIPAAKAAIHAASQMAINHLASKHNNGFHARRLRHIESINEIVTDQYYFQLLDHGELSLSGLSDLTKIQSDNLCHPAIINLMKKGILSFDQAKKITREQRLVVTHPVYFSLFETGIITINEVLDLSDRRSKFLVHPYITNLIQRGKISFKHAKDLPYYLKDIFFNRLYITFFINNDVDWNIFGNIKESQYKILDNKFIAKMIANHVIDFETVVNLMEQNANAAHTLFNLYARALACRMYALCNKAPYRIDSKIDTSIFLVEEAKLAAVECNADPTVFNEWVLSTFLTYLKNNLEHKAANLEGKDDRFPIYSQFIAIISHNTTYPASSNWIDVLTYLINFATTTQENMRIQEFFVDLDEEKPHYQSNATLFSSSSKKRKLAESSTDIMHLCDGLISLSPISSAAEQPTITYHFT